MFVVAGQKDLDGVVAPVGVSPATRLGEHADRKHLAVKRHILDGVGREDGSLSRLDEAGERLIDLDLRGHLRSVASVLEELDAHLDALEQRDDIAGLIIWSGKPGMFIAGADLREFVASLDIEKDKIVQMCRRGQLLFGRLAKSNFVTIAAIDGICVGGGAELAIWCDRRLMSDGPKTEFGFPEVKLGLFPGWGGTARAPRIIGLGNAVEMITGGESINAKNARLMNLASDVVAPDQLIPAAISLIRHEQSSGDYKKDRQCWPMRPPLPSRSRECEGRRPVASSAR